MASLLLQLHRESIHLKHFQLLIPSLTDRLLRPLRQIVNVPGHGLDWYPTFPLELTYGYSLPYT